MICSFVVPIVIFIFVISIEQSLTQGMDNEPEGITFPGEWEPHERSFMVWPSSANIWGSSLLPKVQEDIVRIAQAISKYEPITVIVSPKDLTNAKEMLGPGIDTLEIQVDDLWARDTLPVFVLRKSRNESTVAVSGIDFNFNGWGQKQEHRADGNLAKEFLKIQSIERIKASIVGEGGSFETDGNGTLFLTESSIINRNRNPSKSKETIENELKRILGIKKVIWFPGISGQDITDAHVDSLVRFLGPGKVLFHEPLEGESGDEGEVWETVSKDILKILESSKDAYDRRFEIIKIQEADQTKFEIIGDKDSFLSSYVNYYVINNAVIIPEFGDEEADKNAVKIFETHFPGRQVVPVKINALASGGGGIHCATHELPAVSNGIGVGESPGHLSMLIGMILVVLLLHLT